MKRKCLMILLVISMCLTNIIPSSNIVKAAQAEELPQGTCGESLTWVLENGTLNISGSGNMDNYSYGTFAPWYDYKEQIQNIIIEYGVNNIGEYAFYACNNLESVELPDSVTSIGFQAFKDCSKLSEIIIPNSVTYIYNSAFSGCTGLVNVVIANSVEYIGYEAFCGCYSLTEIQIPGSVTNIGYNAFKFCNNLENINIEEENGQYCSIDGVVYDKNVTELKICPIGKTSIVIPESVTSLETDVFKNSKALTEVTILGNITKIPSNAFYMCENLEKVEISDSVTEIGANAFHGCYKLDTLLLPDMLLMVGDYAFHNCISLTKITLPDIVTSIGDGAFYGCNSLTKFTMPSSVKEIGDFAFAYCNGLTELVFPAELEKIGYWSFKNCVNLNEITFEGNAPELTVYTKPNADVYGTPPNFEPGKAGDIFAEVEATAYYPENNATYTEEFMELCGGSIEWKENVTILNDETGIPDKALYDSILQAADSNNDSILTLKEVEKITSLLVNDLGISSLQGLGICKNLVSIELQNNKICDINEIANLYNLNSLNLSNNLIENVDALSDLIFLTNLSLSDNKITDITPLGNLVNLEFLNIENNEIHDIQVLEKLNIETLLTEGNPIDNDKADIIEDIENAEEGTIFEIELEETTILNQDILTAMQGKDITLDIMLENGIAWSIHGTDLANEAITDLNLSVEKTENGNISEDAITSIAGERETEAFVFAENGILAFPVQITTVVPTGVIKEKAVLIQSIDSQLQLSDTALISNNSITFDLTNRADSVVVYGINGDTNGDDDVTIKDTMQMLHYISGRGSFNEVEKGFADVDMTNSVNLQDLMREMHYVSGRIENLYEAE